MLAPNPMNADEIAAPDSAAPEPAANRAKKRKQRAAPTPAAADQADTSKGPNPRKREGSRLHWIPVHDGALKRLLDLRRRVQKKTGLRPNLSVVVTGLIRTSGHSDALVDALAAYGLKVVAKRKQSTANAQAETAVAETVTQELQTGTAEPDSGEVEDLAPAEPEPASA